MLPLAAPTVLRWPVPPSVPRLLAEFLAEGLQDPHNALASVALPGSLECRSRTLFAAMATSLPFVFRQNSLPFLLGAKLGATKSIARGPGNTKREESIMRFGGRLHTCLMPSVFASVGQRARNGKRKVRNDLNPSPCEKKCAASGTKSRQNVPLPSDARRAEVLGRDATSPAHCSGLAVRDVTARGSESRGNARLSYR